MYTFYDGRWWQRQPPQNEINNFIVNCIVCAPATSPLLQLLQRWQIIANRLRTPCGFRCGDAAAQPFMALLRGNISATIMPFIFMKRSTRPAQLAECINVTVSLLLTARLTKPNNYLDMNHCANPRCLRHGNDARMRLGGCAVASSSSSLSCGGV